MATPQNSGNTPARPNDNQTDPALEAAIQQAGEDIERAPALAKELGIGIVDASAPDTTESGDDGEEDEDEEQDEDDSQYDFTMLRTLHNTVAAPFVLEAGGPLLRSLILCFCSNADKPQGESADIIPKPHRATRNSKNIHFEIGTNAFEQVPTRSGAVFLKGDGIEIWGLDREFAHLENEIVLVLEGENLTLCELRMVKTSDGEEFLRLFNLRTGEFLATNAYLIIGELWATTRHYRKPETAFDRAYNRIYAEDTAGNKSRKWDRKPNGTGLKTRLDRAYEEELAKDAAAAAGGAQ